MSGAGKNVSEIQLELPSAVREIVRSLRVAGGEVRVVGGAVRDTVLGGRPTDWDLATSLPPDRTLSLFPDAVHRDQRLGVLRMALGEDCEVSVTSYREEGGYTDRRHPDSVRFVGRLEQDAARRDFTINAIYVDPDDGRVADPVGGLVDLQRRVLRVIGDGATRFGEDPLRMLRALRFACGCGLELESATLAALRSRAGLVRGLSAERVFEELTRAFGGPGRGRALRSMVDWGLAAELLPEVVPMDGVPQPPEFHPEGDVLTHTCLVLDHVPAAEPVLSWAAVLHDVGKPATFEVADRIRFNGHDQLSAEMAEAVLRRLRAPTTLVDAVVDVCRDHIRFASILQMKPGRRERWMRSPGFGAHLAFHRADCMASHGDLSIFEAVRQLLAELPPPAPAPLCTGADVLALGVAEGPAVGAVLRRLQERLDELENPDREAALEILRSLVDERGQAD